MFNKQSIAWAIAERILNEGGTCGFSYMPDKPDDERKKNLGRVTKLTEGNPRVAFLQPMDVTNDEHIAALMGVASEKLGGLDFLLHSIAFALPDDLKGDTIDTSRAGFKLAMEISAYSLIALAQHARDDSQRRARAFLTLTYYGGERPVPGYNVMGICKAALDSIVKYLAYDLGQRTSASTRSAPGRCKRSPAAARASTRCSACTKRWRRWAATSRTRKPASAARSCSRTCRPASPAKSCTSTAATTSWARPAGCWIESKQVNRVPHDACAT